MTQRLDRVPSDKTDRPSTVWTLPRSSRHLVRHLVPTTSALYPLPPGSSSSPTSTSSSSSTLPLPLLQHLHLLSPYLYFITFIYSFTSSPHSLLSRIALYPGDSYPGPLRHHHQLRRHPLGGASSFLSMHLVFISEINVYNPYLSFI